MIKLYKLFTIKIIFFLIILGLFGNQSIAKPISKNEKPVSAAQSITIIKNANRVTETKYTITPGDIFSVSIYAEPDLAQPEIKVRPDGYATVEPVGEVYVANKSIEEITSLLYKKMSVYLRNPRISVSIRRFNPASIFVYGAVQKPGAYQQNIDIPAIWQNAKVANPKTNLSITNVLALAGGITYDADISHIKITNNQSDVVKEVDMWKLINDGDVSQNVILKSGDSVYVPKIKTALYGDVEFKEVAKSSIFPDTFPVRVMGEVQTPGIFMVSTETPYINSAITMANGYTINARRKAVQVFRKTAKGNISVINVNPKKVDLVLRPNDLVYIRDRKLMKLVRTGGYLSRIFSGIAAPGSMYNNWAKVINPDREYRRK